MTIRLIIAFLLSTLPWFLISLTHKKWGHSLKPIHVFLISYSILTLSSIVGIVILHSLANYLPGVFAIKFPWMNKKLGWICLITFLWLLPNLIGPVLGDLFKIPGITATRWMLPPFNLKLLLGVIVIPLIEELIFRGCMQGALSELIKWQIWSFIRLDSAVILMSFLFSLWHFDLTRLPETLRLVPFVLHFLGGITLGILRNQTGSIWPGFFIHALGNMSGYFQADLNAASG